jgi:hypothetical protein
MPDVEVRVLPVGGSVDLDMRATLQRAEVER